MSCSSVVFTLFLLTPCSQSGGTEIAEAVAAAVSNPNRPAQDLEADADRKPAEVLSFFNIEPGMTVLDVFSGGGYYTEILDSLVGDGGKVLAHNNQTYLSFVGDSYHQRHAKGRLAHTDTIIGEANELELESNSLDAALLVLTWHDFLFADPENGWPAIDEDHLLNKLCNAIKPGGVLGLIDHVANPGGDAADVAKSLHRVDPQSVKDNLSQSCFELQAEAEFLKNKQDDHSLVVFDPAIRGKTDRFVYKFVRK